ncbi:MAG TPA: hypothetical protein VL986_01305 [Terracidiphilus sp.]|nr:hypothetical protein [Terracidiphilus sp.]
MELLDRYLEAVRKYLPWERQDDIIAELRANLEAQLEDKQEELGHTLTPDEAKAWVGQLPPPAVMAGRYRRQQYLIGPGLFPIYSMVLRIAVFWIVIVMVIVGAIRLFTEPWSAGAVAAAIWNVGFVTVVNAAIITVIFAAIEYAFLHYPEKFPQIAQHVSKWDLKDLPPIERASCGKKKTLAHAIADAAAHGLLVVWLLLIPQYPFLLLGPGEWAVRALPYEFAPVIVHFYWAVVALNAVQFVWKVADVYTRAWMGERRVQQVVFKLLGLIPLGILLMAPDNLWIVLKNPAADFEKYSATLAQANHGIFIALRVVLAITVITFVVELCKWGFRSYKQRVVSAH